jgi:H+/Cl- antiporter ClcA
MADIIAHFHHRGKLPYDDNLPIIPASLVGLVGGSSAGPEGVLTQVCGSIGTWLAERLGGPELVRVLTQAGMGAGFGAFLGSPVGGAILWLEMPHKEGLEYYESLIPTLTSSVVGYLVMALLLDVNLTPTWHPGAVQLGAPLDLVRALAVGAAAGVAALLYSYLFRGVGKAFAWLRTPLWVTTTLAGLVIGTLGAIFPLTYFYGRNEVDALIAGHFPLLLLAGMLLAKMLAASVTIRGHWQGGLIIPHMFMGAVVGKLLALAVPGLDPALAIVAGMAAFNAAATHTPLASALIVIALTGTGGAIPVFIASLAGFFIGQRVELIGGKRHRSDFPAGGGVTHAVGSRLG